MPLISETENSRNVRYEDYLKRVAHADKSVPFYREIVKRGMTSAYFELAKLELEHRGIENISLDPDNLRSSLRHIQTGKDCGDFVLPAFLQMMVRYPDSQLLTDELRAEIKQTILNYKYWMDEPGERENYCNYFTENHQILQHSAELLAGQMYPDGIFQNGMTGREHMAHARAFIDRWFDWRARFGFSEWLSNSYYEEDLLALVDLAQMARDREVVRRAEMVNAVLLFDIAVNSFHGDFVCTNGRTYPRMLIDPQLTGTSAVTAVLWGQGTAERTLNKPALLMAIGNYTIPRVLADIAHDQPEIMENRQRSSLDVDDGEKYGVSPADFDNIMLYWGIQEYDHRKVIDNSLKALAPWDAIGERIHAFKEKYEQHDRARALVDDDPDFTAMTQADIYTYRTPNYQLSCAQNFRRGRQGFQQHIWQATLGGKAVVYTNHPGSLEYLDRPNYWMGNGVLPKAVAYRNVLVCIYRIEPTYTNLWQSHVYFPQREFDEVTERYGWIFGRRGGGYVAVHSMNGGRWSEPESGLYEFVYRNEPDRIPSPVGPYDFVSRGHANVWVCELGEEGTHGSFRDFVRHIAAAELGGDIYHYVYRSPSLGKVETGWDEGLKVNGEDIVIHDYPRYDNPYCRADFNRREMDIAFGGKKLHMDFSMPEMTEE